MLRLLLVFGFLLNIYTAHADKNITTHLSKQAIVAEIELRGLDRTKPFVIYRELRFKVNEALNTEDLLASIQNLKNLEIFSSVIPLLELQDNNRVKVIIQISEKWTTIPYLNFSSGGGTRYIYSGVYDINMFGSFIEMGAQYNNWNKEHGVLGWYIDRRLFDRRITLQLVAGKTLRPRNLLTRDAEKEGDYILSRNEVGFSIIKEFKSWLSAGVGFELENDRIINTNYEASLDQPIKNQLNNSHTSNNKFTSIFLNVGKLNYDNYLIEGKRSSLTVKHGGKYTRSDTNLTMFRWENKAFWRLPHFGNAALRFTLAQTDAEAVQHLFYVGGFEHVRGYLDGQLRSKAYWQINSEYRIPSYRSNWLVLQHIFFFDAVQVADKISQLKDESSIYYSAGIGIRVISPKIYSFNGRLDIALLTKGESQNLISFGAQQFF